MNTIRTTIFKAPMHSLTAALSSKKPAAAASIIRPNSTPVRSLKLSATPKEMVLFQDSPWDAKELLQAFVMPASRSLTSEDIPRLVAKFDGSRANNRPLDSKQIEREIRQSLTFVAVLVGGITSMLSYSLYKANKTDETKLGFNFE